MTSAQVWQSQFQRLVPLAWNLRLAGLSVTLQLQVGSDPALVLQGAVEYVKVRVAWRAEGWFYTWGRGPDRSVSADALGEAGETIARLVRRS